MHLQFFPPLKTVEVNVHFKAVVSAFGVRLSTGGAAHIQADRVALTCAQRFLRMHLFIYC